MKIMAFVLLCIVSIYSRVGECSANGASIILTAAPKNTKFAAATNTPVWLNLTIRNAGAKSFAGEIATSREFYCVIVDIDKACKNSFKRSTQFAVMGELETTPLKLLPESVKTVSVLIDDWWVPVKPGPAKGTVHLRLWDAKSHAIDLYAPFAVNIAQAVPVNATALLKTSLARKLRGRNANDRWDAVRSCRALLPVDSIPLLRLALKCGDLDVESTAITVLWQIKSLETRKILIIEEKSPNSAIAAMAREFATDGGPWLKN